MLVHYSHSLVLLDCLLPLHLDREGSSYGCYGYLIYIGFWCRSLEVLIAEGTKSIYALVIV